MERAKTLYDLIVSFKCSPLTGEDFEKFYVPTVKARGQDTALRLNAYLRANQNSFQKIIVSGQKGAGLSTEIWQLKKYLSTDFKIINCLLHHEVNLADFDDVDLIFAVLSRILCEIRSEGARVDPYAMDILYRYLRDEKLIESLRFEKSETGAGAGTKAGFLNTIIASLKGVLATGKEAKASAKSLLDPKISQIILGINKLIAALGETYKKQNKIPVLIIQDLDKLCVSAAQDLFFSRRKILTGFDIHTIYLLPAFLCYSKNFNEIQRDFDHYERFGMIGLHRKSKSFEAAFDALKNIVEKRAELSLFEPKCLDFIIEKSGGSLADLFRMITDAALNAISADENADRIDFKAAKRAFLRIKNNFERTLLKKYADTLKTFYKNSDKAPLLIDEYFMELVHYGTIIEYNDEKWWCDLHPAIKEILAEPLSSEI